MIIDYYFQPVLPKHVFSNIQNSNQYFIEYYYFVNFNHSIFFMLSHSIKFKFTFNILQSLFLIFKFAILNVQYYLKHFTILLNFHPGFFHIQ